MKIKLEVSNCFNVDSKAIWVCIIQIYIIDEQGERPFTLKLVK